MGSSSSISSYGNDNHRQSHPREREALRRDAPGAPLHACGASRRAGHARLVVVRDRRRHLHRHLPRRDVLRGVAPRHPHHHHRLRAGRPHRLRLGRAHLHQPGQGRLRARQRGVLVRVRAQRGDGCHHGAAAVPRRGCHDGAHGRGGRVRRARGHLPARVLHLPAHHHHHVLGR